MLTKRGSPLDFNIKFQNDEIHHTVKIDLQLLEALTKDTDTILFIDLIMRMIKEVPDQRETCESLIEHVAFQNEEGWLEIVQLLAEKCFNGDECVNEYLAKILDKKEVHMEGFLGEDSAEWKELLAEIAKFSVKPNLKICSSILKMFAEQVLICCWMLTLHLYSYYCIFRVASVSFNQSCWRCQTSSHT